MSTHRHPQASQLCLPRIVLWWRTTFNMLHVTVYVLHSYFHNKTTEVYDLINVQYLYMKEAFINYSIYTAFSLCFSCNLFRCLQMLTPVCIIMLQFSEAANLNRFLYYYKIVWLLNWLMQWYRVLSLLFILNTSVISHTFTANFTTQRICKIQRNYSSPTYYQLSMHKHNWLVHILKCYFKVHYCLIIYLIL